MEYTQKYTYVYVYMCIYPTEGSFIVYQILHLPLLSPKPRIYHHSAHQALSDDDSRYSSYGNLLHKTMGTELQPQKNATSSHL